MSFESLKVKKIERQSGAKEEVKKKIRVMIAWGVITLSTLGIMKMVDGKKRGQKYNSKSIIADIEKKQPLFEIEKMEFNKKIEYLKNNFSENVFPQLEKNVKVNEESESKLIEIKGFEKAGFSNKDFKNLWSEKYYPKGWLNDEINTIEYKSEDSENNNDYGQNKESKYAGTAELQKSGKSKIEFHFKDPKKYDSKKVFVETLDWYFSHESGHANDWESESRMDFKKRVDFLYEVSQNCFRENAFRDLLGYIDSIRNTDPNKERYYKTREYWGSCCEYYFTFPEMLKQDYPLEFAMVNKYIGMEDPNYNPFDKGIEKKELIEQITKE